MNRYELSPSQKTVLHELLDRWERSKDPSRRISLRVSEEKFPDYFDDANPQGVRKWEQDMLALEALGWLMIDRGRGADAHRLARMTLQRSHGATVAAALERMNVSVFRSRILSLHDQYKIQYQDNRHWFPVWWPRLLEREKERAHRLSPPQESRHEVLEETEITFSAMARIVAPPLRKTKASGPLTWRQFSVGEFSDSKKLNPLKKRIVRLLAEFSRPDLQAIRADDSVVLSEFGIEVKQELILISGPFRAKSSRSSSLAIVGDQWQPFAALPRQFIIDHEFKWDFGLCSGILTIENEESFQSWCRTNSETNLLCLYLGGFPSRFKMDFLRRISSHMPFYHWGDMDVGGIQIFRYLERELSRKISPYHMLPDYLTKFSQSAQPLRGAEVRRLSSISAEIGSSHPLTPLIREMLRLRSKLEQEAIPPNEDLPMP